MKIIEWCYQFSPVGMNLTSNLTNGCFVLCEESHEIELLLVAALPRCHHRSLLGDEYFTAHLLFIIYDFKGLIKYAKRITSYWFVNESSFSPTDANLPTP